MIGILNIAQIIVSILLVIVVLLQQRGGGLSTVFGGEGTIYRTRRGVERGIYWATIVLGALFLGIALLNIFLQ